MIAIMLLATSFQRSHILQIGSLGVSVPFSQHQDAPSHDSMCSEVGRAQPEEQLEGVLRSHGRSANLYPFLKT